MKNKSMTLRIPPEAHERLRATAEREDRSVSAVIRRAIERYVATSERMEWKPPAIGPASSYVGLVDTSTGSSGSGAS